MTPLDAAREDAARIASIRGMKHVAADIRAGKYDDGDLVKDRLEAILFYLASQQANAPELVERLRSNAPLTVCPFDRRSPDYFSTPNDKPCKMCGGEPEGPDKCTGADLRIMTDAADTLTAAHAQIAELRAQIDAKDEAFQALIDATAKAIRENDQPNRVVFPDGFVIEGRLADEWLKFMRIIQVTARAAMGGGE